ncbi:hypothetical protein [Nocardia inohanensis]|nr:hypothetical protein [Nocardia inohanensis]
MSVGNTLAVARRTRGDAGVARIPDPEPRVAGPPPGSRTTSNDHLTAS